MMKGKQSTSSSHFLSIRFHFLKDLQMLVPLYSWIFSLPLIHNARTHAEHFKIPFILVVELFIKCHQQKI